MEKNNVKPQTSEFIGEMLKKSVQPDFYCNKTKKISGKP